MTVLTPIRPDPAAPAPYNGAVLDASTSVVPLAPAPHRPRAVRYGKHLRGLFDQLIGGCSLVSNDPVLDMRDFAWTCALRRDWRAIRNEALAVALDGRAAPSLSEVSPDHPAIAAPERWRSFFLHGYGLPMDENLARCPATARALADIPGLVSASFSILAPGTHIPAHRGATKGLITCHLGLIVPQDGDIRMRVGDRVVRWAEGETLVFDDTYDHEVWNDSTGTRVVLLIQFERPLAQPGKWIAGLFLRAIRRSDSVQEAQANIHNWNHTFDT